MEGCKDSYRIQMDGGTEGRRDRESGGRRDVGSEGGRDGGTEGRNNGRTEEHAAFISQMEGRI